jgi:hypothetical protein
LEPQRINNRNDTLRMHFTFTPKRGFGMAADARTFQVERLLRNQPGAARDVSHLIDRTYHYHSPKELLWHLAERFGLPVQAVTLRAV